jgi:hypothetical protein
MSHFYTNTISPTRRLEKNTTSSVKKKDQEKASCSSTPQSINHSSSVQFHPLKQTLSVQLIHIQEEKKRRFNKVFRFLKDIQKEILSLSNHKKISNIVNDMDIYLQDLYIEIQQNQHLYDHTIELLILRLRVEKAKLLKIQDLRQQLY